MQMPFQPLCSSLSVLLIFSPSAHPTSRKKPPLGYRCSTQSSAPNWLLLTEVVIAATGTAAAETMASLEEAGALVEGMRVAPPATDVKVEKAKG